MDKTVARNYKLLKHCADRAVSSLDVGAIKCELSVLPAAENVYRLL